MKGGRKEEEGREEEQGGRKGGRDGLRRVELTGVIPW